MATIPLWDSITKKAKSPESAILEQLSLVKVFEDISRGEVKFIRSLCHIRTYEAGHHVFQSGEPGVGMYVILEGSVEIYRMEKGDRKRQFQVLQEGDSFGELGLVEDVNRSASAITAEPTRLIGFFRPDLESIIQRKPRLAARIMLNLSRTIGHKLIRTNVILEENYSPDFSSVVITDSETSSSEKKEETGR